MAAAAATCRFSFCLFSPALFVGTLDEWLQWFIPVRVGEARDVFLNLVAISCGLLFGAAIDPPPTFGRHLRPASVTGVCLMAAGVLLVFAAFVNAVHLGYAIRRRPHGVFKSHFTAEELAAHARERAERWRSDPPITLKRLSREDQFMDEGLWHVRRRNESWADGDVQRAWNENLILENVFHSRARHAFVRDAGAEPMGAGTTRRRQRPSWRCPVVRERCRAVSDSPSEETVILGRYFPGRFGPDAICTAGRFYSRPGDAVIMWSPIATNSWISQEQGTEC